MKVDSVLLHEIQPVKVADVYLLLFVGKNLICALQGSNYARGSPKLLISILNQQSVCGSQLYVGVAHSQHLC